MPFGMHDETLDVDLAGRFTVRDRSHDVPVVLRDVPDEPRGHELGRGLGELRYAVIADQLRLDRVRRSLQVCEVTCPLGDLKRCQTAHSRFLSRHVDQPTRRFAPRTDERCSTMLGSSNDQG